MEVVILIQRKLDALLHYVHVQPEKVHPIVVIALVVDLLVLTGSVNVQVVFNILVVDVGLQHLIYVQQEKQQQQLTHVTVQAEQHLLEQVELELVNVQTVKHIQLQDVVLQHQIIAHQVF